MIDDMESQLGQHENDFRRNRGRLRERERERLTAPYFSGPGAIRKSGLFSTSPFIPGSPSNLIIFYIFVTERKNSNSRQRKIKLI